MFSPSEVRSLSEERAELGWTALPEGIPEPILTHILQGRSRTLKSGVEQRIFRPAGNRLPFGGVYSGKRIAKRQDEGDVVDVNEYGCSCSCRECQDDNCPDCSNESCTDAACADARATAMLKSRVSAAIDLWKSELPS